MTFLTVSQYCSQNFHNLIYQSKLFRCEVPRFGIYYCFPWYIVLLFQLQKTVLIGRITFRYATFLGRRKYSTVLYCTYLAFLLVSLGSEEKTVRCILVPDEKLYSTSWFRRKNCTVHFGSEEKLYGGNCTAPYCLCLFVKFLYFSTYQYLFAQKGASLLGKVIWPKVNLVL